VTSAPPPASATPPPAERAKDASNAPAMTLARDEIWDQPEVKRAWDLTHVSNQEEAQLGAELHDLILQLNRRSEDGPWQQRVEEAAKPFLKTLGRKDVRYTFTVLESDAVCAFSHPGGYVYVCRGLFDLIGEDEDYALEFAVGHEIAHVELQHALKYLRDPGVMKLPGGTLQKLYMILIPFAYPDEAEFDADRWTYSRMRQAGRSDHRSLAFLRKLERYAKSNGFNNGRVKPKPKDAESSLLENHYRAHTATWKRLNELKDFIAAAANPKK
jgi:predicted Zn-dependent protease